MAAEPLFTGANHLCVVTADLTRAVRTWSDRYGVGGWVVAEYDAGNMRVDGAPAPFAMRLAQCRLGPAFRLELIQPLDGASLFADSLLAHGGADHVHHVRLDVAGFEQAVDRLAALGVRAVMAGGFRSSDPEQPDAELRYFDTTGDLGFLLEVSGGHRGFTPAAALASKR